MTLDLEELKKNHQTSYLATSLEKLAREEAEVREMLAGDDSLHEMAAKELKFIQEERERIEAQVQEIFKKGQQQDKEGEITNEIVLEVRAGAGGDELMNANGGNGSQPLRSLPRLNSMRMVSIDKSSNG